MIFDNIKNKDLYVKAHPLFEKAFGFIEEYLKNPKEPGQYSICDEDLFAKVMDYETRSEGLYEVHNKYIDIQFIAQGAEGVFYGIRSDFTETEYHEDGDYMFLEGDEERLNFILQQGEFAVFFPEDAHKPSMDTDKKNRVVKVVLKVKV